MEIERQIDAMNAAIDRLDTNQKIIDLNQDKIVATQVYFSEVIAELVACNSRIKELKMMRLTVALQETLDKVNKDIALISQERIFDQVEEIIKEVKKG